MNKEDIIKEINNGEIKEGYWPERSDCCDVENESFENVILDNIECYRLTFNKCTFKNVQFIDNTVEWIEVEECTFEDCVFSGKIGDILLTVGNSSFERCQIKDFELNAVSEQLEVVDCKFDSCTFSDMKIEADLTLSGGSMTNCRGENVTGKMNMVWEVEFDKCIFENINMNTAVLRNSLKDVEFINVNQEGILHVK